MKRITSTPENFDKAAAVRAHVRQEAFRKTDAELADDLATFERFLALNAAGELDGDTDGQREYLEWERDAILAEQALRLRHGSPSRQDRRFDDRALIDAIKARVSIVDVLTGTGVVLKQSGPSWRGCCPFHGGSNPYALQVTDTGPNEPGRFYCHNCLKHGDAIRALMLRAEFDFPEAVRALARVAGIDVPTNWDRPPRDEQTAVRAPVRRRRTREVTHG